MVFFSIPRGDEGGKNFNWWVVSIHLKNMSQISHISPNRDENKQDFILSEHRQIIETTTVGLFQFSRTNSKRTTLNTCVKHGPTCVFLFTSLLIQLPFNPESINCLYHR